MLCCIYTRSNKRKCNVIYHTYSYLIIFVSRIQTHTAFRYNLDISEALSVLETTEKVTSLGQQPQQIMEKLRNVDAKHWEANHMK